MFVVWAFTNLYNGVRAGFNEPGGRSLRVFCTRVGFHELVFLFLLFNDPQLAEGGFYFGNLVVMYATERR